MLADSKLFAGLSGAELDATLQQAKPKERLFKRGDIIWREGDLVDGVGLLAEGTLFCQRYHSDGKIQLARLFTPGDILNVEAAVSNKRTSPTFVSAAAAGNYLWFPHSGLLKNPAIPDRNIIVMQRNLLAYLADDTIRFLNKSDILSRRTVRDRVILFLNVLRKKHGNEVDIGMSQEEFAQYLCVDRSSLSYELNKMRTDGLIKYKKKRFWIYYANTDRT